MKESKVDLLLHPIRFRVIQLLVGGRTMTPQQIAESLPDVAQATLYRHLNALAQGRMLQVVDQRPVRGALEKVYGLQQGAANLTPEELQQASREELLAVFMGFMTSLVGSFDRYLQQEAFDLQQDGVGFRSGSYYLNDAEFQAFTSELRDVYAKYMALGPESGRVRRTVATVFIPEPEGSVTEGETRDARVDSNE